MSGPLEGLRAVEIGDRGEVAGKLLADAGADVIRVEMPSGARSRSTGPFVGDEPGAASLHFAYLNTNKRGVTLNLTDREGASLWGKLVANTDIVIDSVGPGALDTLRVGYESLQSNRKLIWCSITPFGLTGPRRDWVTNDLVSMALGGPPMSTGYDDHDVPPIRPDGEHSLAMAGEYATIGIIAAVLQRDRGARGQLIDVSIHECVAGTTEGAFPNWEYNQAIVQRQTGRHSSPNRTPPWQHVAADGEYSMAHGGGVPRSPQIWPRLLDWLEANDAVEDLRDPQYEEVIHSDPRATTEGRRHIIEVVGRLLEKLTADEGYRGGQAIHMPFAHVRRPEQNLDDPHWEDRGFWLSGEVPGHDEPVRYPGAPYRFTKSPVEFRRRAPLLGEHNTSVYGALGLDAGELTRLAKARVI